MPTLIPLANLRGEKGEKGDPGLPGVNAVENDAAVAGYIKNALTKVRAALSNIGIPTKNVNNVTLPDGTVLSRATLDSNDRIMEGWDGGIHVVQGLRVGETVMADLEYVGIGGGYVVGETPQTSRQTELVVDSSGNVPEEMVKRWLSRGGASASAITPIDNLGVLGQSNGGRVVGTFLQQLYTPSDWCLSWNKPLNQWDTESGVPWLGSGVARAWWERDARAVGRRVGAVQAAIGGTGFGVSSVVVDISGTYQTATWNYLNPDGAQVNLAFRARDMLMASMAAAPPGSALKAIFWSQGEEDRATMSTAQYSDALDAMIAWFRSELGIPDLPFIISPFTPQIISENESGTNNILKALEDTPRRVPYTAYSLRNVDDSLAGENIHWSPDAQHRRGRAMIIDPDPLIASAWDQAQLNRGRALEVTTVIDEPTVTITSGSVTAGDVGKLFGGPTIATGSRIQSVTDPTHIVMTADALSNGTGVLALVDSSGYRTPPGLKISRSGNVATITWLHPPTRVESFLLETCVDGVGTDWSTQTLSHAMAHKHVMTVSAGTPLWARIAAVTPSGTSFKSEVVRA